MKGPLKRLIFGTAGLPLSAKTGTTQAGIERVKELGLGCMEIEFVQGVHMRRQTAALVAEVGRATGVRLSAHAPYYINLYAREPDKVAASRERILQTARIASVCGATDIVFHPAFYLGDDPQEVYRAVRGRLEEIVQLLKEEGNGVRIRPELTGKRTQFGNLEEIINLSAEVEGVAPCIDFAHWHARTEVYNTYREFVSILRLVEDKLGKEALGNMHIHVSGIHYGRGGEIKHLPLQESDLQYMALLRALKEFNAAGTVICESPILEIDALLLQEAYESIT